MKHTTRSGGWWAACVAGLAAGVGVEVWAADPSLTVYNGGFAVVREAVPLRLKAGEVTVSYREATRHLEPDSVILRDPAGKVAFRILEQGYRAETISPELLLHLNEGKELEFLRVVDGKEERVRGRVIRSGHQPNLMGAQRYGNAFYQNQMRVVSGGSATPIVLVDGVYRFGLPGQPLFPALADEEVLRPTLEWRIASDRAAEVAAELSYVTGGMRWEASYNLVAPETGDVVDLVGWVTLDNQSGRTFSNASIRLMAGDVAKVAEGGEGAAFAAGRAVSEMDDSGPAVTEKAFDEFHLYTLTRRTTLRNEETKQVEFLRAAGAVAKTVYVYSGFDLDPRYRHWDAENIRNQRDYGTRSNPKVWVMREIENTKANRLGEPLPKGRVRFYREGDGGALEFTGEALIDHTPAGETVRVTTGNAFDLVGERRQMDYRIDTSKNWLEEAFEIRLRNRKKEPVEIRVPERAYRWIQWSVVETNRPDWEKKGARELEWTITVPPEGEEVLTYRLRYTW